MQGYCDVYKWTILKRTSPEVKCLHLTSSRREMCTLSVSNVIYHKFSHGAAFYTLNGKNVNVMLEWWITLKEIICSCRRKCCTLETNILCLTVHPSCNYWFYYPVMSLPVLDRVFLCCTAVSLDCCIIRLWYPIFKNICL